MTTGLRIFADRTIDQRLQTLADYIPNGAPFEAKNIPDSDLFALLTGLAREVERVDEKMNEISSEHDPRCTNSFLGEWESALGIPDGCFNADGNDDERRNHVLIKLGLAVQTAQDFEDLGQTFGFDTEVVGGAFYGTFPMAFPIVFFPTGTDARYTMIVDLPEELRPNVFPFVFPFVFGAREGNIIECLFDRLKPANTKNLYRYRL